MTFKKIFDSNLPGVRLGVLLMIDTFILLYYMSVECTNSNLKSAQLAQLGQPAPKLELDLYIPQT